MLIMILNKISAHRLKLNQQIQRNQHDSVNHNRQFTLTVQKTACLTGFYYTAIPGENSKIHGNGIFLTRFMHFTYHRIKEFICKSAVTNQHCG